MEPINAMVTPPGERRWSKQDKAVTRIFFRGCHVELERRRREDRGAVDAEVGGVWGGGIPSQKIFAFFKFQNG